MATTKEITVSEAEKPSTRKTAAKAKKPKKIIAQGKVWVTRQFKEGGKLNAEEYSEEKLEVRCFDVEPAYVKASYGMTINTGNFNSARCDAGVTMPCYTEELLQAFERAWAIAQDQIQEQTKNIRRA